MAAAFLMEFKGVTKEQYDKVVKDLELGGKPAPKGIFHIASFEGSTLHILDVWESESAMKEFTETKLAPLFKKYNIPAPTVTPWPVHNYLK